MQAEADVWFCRWAMSLENLTNFNKKNTVVTMAEIFFAILKMKLK